MKSGDDENDQSSKNSKPVEHFSECQVRLKLVCWYQRVRDKCSHGGCTISPSNYIAHEGKLYCKHHHIQLFGEKGNYSRLENEPEKHSRTEQATHMEIAAES